MKNATQQTLVAFTTALLLVPLAALRAADKPGDAGRAPSSSTKSFLGKLDYRVPAREYRTHEIGGWTLFVEASLAANDPELARQALDRLTTKLEVTRKLLPPATRARLQKLPIYLMHGSKSPSGGRDSGAQYHQRTAPKFRKHLDPRWGDVVVIHSAANYVKLSELWSVKVLVHEFAHAWHLGQWPEKQPEIYQAWENAMHQELYRGVKDDKGAVLERGYAAQNQLEYFAELSCMYFCGCNYQPFNRSELKTYDPTGYALIEKMWGISPDSPRPSPTR